jgi:hypothetical protein
LLASSSAAAQQGNPQELFQQWLFKAPEASAPFLTFERWSRLGYDVDAAYLSGIFDALVALSDKGTYYAKCKARLKFTPMQWTAFLHAAYNNSKPASVVAALTAYLDNICGAAD